jgi:Heterokaryon incompatibility protein (HET)
VIELEPGEASTPLICRLHVSDIIVFEGVAIHHLQKRIEYDALSYCWGTGPADNVIQCNAHEVRINSNLAAALRSFRPSSSQPPCFLWVDAICINQEDPEEKARQVQIMLTIFQKAKSVLVWLDDALDLDQDAFGFLIQIEANGQTKLPLLPKRDTSAHRRLMKTVRTLCQRPWFRQTWIRQEYFAARAVLFLCDGKVIARDRFEMLARKLPVAADVEVDTEFESAESKYGFEEALDTIWPGPAANKSNIGFMFLANQLGRGESRSLLPIMTRLDIFRFMRSSLFFDATNLVDKVYGLVGILGSGTIADDLQSQPIKNVAELSLQINYCKSVSQVYQDFTKHIINNRGGDLSILEMHIPDPANSGLNLPSWTKNWNLPSQKALKAICDSSSRWRWLLDTNPADWPASCGSRQTSASSYTSYAASLSRLPSQSFPYLRIRGFRIATISQQPQALPEQTHLRSRPPGYAPTPITGEEPELTAEYTEVDSAFCKTADVTVNVELQGQRTKRNGRERSTYDIFVSDFNGACLHFVQSAQVGDDLIFAQGSKFPLLARSHPHQHPDELLAARSTSGNEGAHSIKTPTANTYYTYLGPVLIVPKPVRLMLYKLLATESRLKFEECERVSVIKLMNEAFTSLPLDCLETFNLI